MHFLTPPPHLSLKIDIHRKLCIVISFFVEVTTTLMRVLKNTLQEL